MKARLKDERPVLSIGMIVKNEEKKLRRCLDSLQPLMEQVNCELIIVDTGSVDSTKDIATEYTDKIYNFEWINDFSAARNYGLDKSTGIWFLFVDADDVLKNPEELIKFLNNKKSAEKYRTGMLIYHSPMDEAESNVSRLWVGRLFLNGMGNRFEGKIHEVPKSMIPFKYFRETYLWHDGYMYETPEDMQRKMDRNNTLLEEELEERPDDIRLIAHYAATCPYEKRMEVLEHGIEIVQSQPEHYYFADIYWRMSRILLQEKKYQEILNLYEEYKELTNRKEHVGEMEIALNAGAAHAVLKDFNKAIECYQRYLYLYDQYQNGDILENDTMSTNCERVTAGYMNFALEKCALCYSFAKKYLEAFETVLKFDLANTKLLNFSEDLQIALSSAENLDRFDLVCRLEDWLESQDTEELDTTEYNKALTRFLCKSFWIEGKIEKALSDTAELTGELPDLFRLLSPDADWTELDAKLNQDNKYMGPYQALLLCCALRYHHNPSALLAAVGRDRLSDAGEAISIFTPAPELADMLLSWETTLVSNEVLFRGWMADLYSRSFANCPEEKKLPILHKMMDELCWYTSHLYHPDILVPDETKLLALPSGHRFGYWAGLALEAEKNGDHLQYIRYLRSAAESCPEMAQAVKMLIQEAQDIKGIIEKMILSGQLETAQSILSQYELINPDDPDIPVLKSAIMQPPVLSEI